MKNDKLPHYRDKRLQQFVAGYRVRDFQSFEWQLKKRLTILEEAQSKDDLRLLMPYRMLCNDVQREGAKPSPDLAFGLFCYVPLHNIRYGTRLLPSNHFEALIGDRKGQFSIRINQQWRLCFEWSESENRAVNIEVVDYH